ncbi:MAG: hypothetical protein Q8P41_06620 [Pseudomonadota bacterium]|nr:hypothetical protein [Pseudomonadota bacterium]
MTKRMLPTLLATLVAMFALVAPSAAYAGHRGQPSYGPPPGRVLVTNQSGGTVNVALSGQQSRALSSWQTAELLAAPGDTTLRATYLQFGVVRTLQTARLVVNPGRTVGVTLSPEKTARVQVVNQSDRYAQLVVDGQLGAAFNPGEAKVVPMPAGRHDLALTADGRTLSRTRMDLRPFEEPRWLVDVPRAGTLVVTNPLPIAIELVCAKGLVRSVPAYGQTTYATLPLGGFHLTARRTSGEFIDGETADIRAGATTGWRVDAPRTGFVTFDSAHWLGTEVRLDGRLMVTLAPDGAHRTETLVGWHEVEVRDDRGRVVHQGWVEVKPFDAVRVDFGAPSHQRAYSDNGHDSRGDRDDRRDPDDHDDHDDHRGHDHDGAVVAEGESCGMH